MLRIRLHGHGGQGMKTASHILRSAALHAGFLVQDAPVYGAERPGMPVAAFPRIARALILERGAIARADLVVVAERPSSPHQRHSPWQAVIPSVP